MQSCFQVQPQIAEQIRVWASAVIAQVSRSPFASGHFLDGKEIFCKVKVLTKS